jgi:ribosomal protein S15P/S13E
MEHLLKSIEAYLTTPNVGHAILITGDWGTGKTYFWKTEIEPLVSTLNVPEHSLPRNFKPVYISLFGIDDLSSIDKKIFFEVCSNFKFLNSSPMKAAAGIGKKLLSSMEDFGITGKILDTVTDIEIDYKKLASLGDCVLCFDDLERAKIDIEELLGYINQLVEHDHIRTIIIANEEEIANISEKNLELKLHCAIQSMDEESKKSLESIEKRVHEIFEKKTRYNFIKEKVIGRTYHYVPNIDKVVHNLISNKYKEEEISAFLENNCQLILDTLKKIENGKNIRILNQALGDYLGVYKALVDVDERLIEILAQKLLILILVVSFELKSGILSKEEVLELASKGEASWMAYGIIGNNKDKTELEKFIMKYFSGQPENLVVIRSVLEYIVSGYLNLDNFNVEVKKFLPTERTNLSLFLDSVWVFEDDVFKNVCDKILKDIPEGKYELKLYYGLFKMFAVLSREKLIAESIVELKELFIRGIKASYASEKSKENSSIIIGYEDHSPEAEEIKECLEQLLEKLEVEKVEKKLKNQIECFPTGLLDFCIQITRGDEAINPIFSLIDIKQLFDALIKLNNKDLTIFSSAIRERYNSGNINSYLSKDCAGLLQLASYIEEYILSKQTSLRTYQFKLLSKKLYQVVGHVCMGYEKCKKKLTT